MNSYQVKIIDMAGAFAESAFLIEALPRRLRELFSLESESARLSFEFEFLEAPSVNKEEVSTGELHEIFGTFASSADPKIKSLGLLIAGAHRDFPVNLGLMFDQEANPLGNSIPREATAVFLTAIRKRAPKLANFLFEDPNPEQKEAVFHELFLRTACHEFGHIFNLGHDWRSPSSVMAPSWELWESLKEFKRGEERWERYKMLNSRLCPGHLKALTSAYSSSPHPQVRAEVAPGQQVFLGYDCAWKATRIAPADSGESAQEQAFTIALADQRSYLCAEPMILEVALANPAVPPHVLRPGYSDFKLLIKRPGQELELFPALSHQCSGPEDRVLGNSVARQNPRIHWGSRGSVFHTQGQYSLQAVFFWKGEALRSNKIQVTLRDPNSALEKSLVDLLQDSSVGQYLALGEPEHLEAQAAPQIDQALQTLLKTEGAVPLPTTVYLAYARARALLKAQDAPTKTRQAKLSRAWSYLKRLLPEAFSTPSLARVLGPTCRLSAARLGLHCAQEIGDKAAIEAWTRELRDAKQAFAASL